jgi:exocyst complex component 5
MVMQVFLQRVFAQSVCFALDSKKPLLIIPTKIQQHMEQLLHRGEDVSDLAYLRVLQLVHIQTSALVEDLKIYELPAVSTKATFESEVQRTLNGAANMFTATPATVSNMLETAMEELFVPYIEGQRYVDRESKNLAAMYAELLTNFSRYHVCALYQTTRLLCPVI